MITDGPLTFTGLIKFLQYIKGPDHWHYVGETGEPAFADSWVNYGSGNQVARFIKDAAGVVHIEGLVASGSIGEYTVFTLPTGYYPTAIMHFVNISNNALGHFQVMPSGRIKPKQGSNTWFAIYCSFYVG